MKGLTIGQLAKKARVNVETVRYYERRGLIPEPPRLESGYRQYTLDAVNRLCFIKRAQHLGFTLKEIGQLLALIDNNNLDCKEIRKFTIEKIRDIEAKIDHLQSLKKAMEDLARGCPGQGPISECTIIEALITPFI